MSAAIDATMPMYAIAPHPHWCDPRACCTDRGWDRDRDLVVHSLVIHESDGRRVELSRADKLDSANGRPVHRGVAAVQLICDDMEDQGLSADQAAALGAALSHAAALLNAQSPVDRSDDLLREAGRALGRQVARELFRG